MNKFYYYKLFFHLKVEMVDVQKTIALHAIIETKWIKHECSWFNFKDCQNQHQIKIESKKSCTWAWSSTLFEDGHLWVELITILITKTSSIQHFQFELWNNSHCIAQRMAHVKKHIILNR